MDFNDLKTELAVQISEEGEDSYFHVRAGDLAILINALERAKRLLPADKYIDSLSPEESDFVNAMIPLF